MQIMKKLLVSLLLSTLVAICWVLIIHTLKWIAIRGNDFEAALSQAQASASMPAAAIVQAQVGTQLVQRSEPSLASHLGHLQLLGASAAPYPPNYRAAQQSAQQAVRRVHSAGSSRNYELEKVDRRRARRRTRAAAQDGSNEENDEVGHETSLAPPASPRRPASPAQSSPAQSSSARPITWPAELPTGADESVDDGQDEDGWPAPAANRPGQVDQVQRQANQLAELQPSRAPSQGQLSPGLSYKAPFFTSWFVSIWNILFMPIFALISSCCFRNEDSTTKKLLV